MSMVRIIESAPCYFFPIAACSVLGIFIAVMMFGISASMPMNSEGQMPNCPFMSDTASICPMTIVQHIAYWQQLFTTTVPSMALLFLIVVLVIVAVSKKPISLEGVERDTIHAHQSSNAEIGFADYLQHLFSTGILNPKIYNIASIPR